MLAAESGASTRFRASGEAVDRAARAIVFDSGLGGVTVLREIRALRPDVDMLYAADDAGFPYGAWSEPALVERVLAVMERLIGDRPPDAVVIACNTASTLVLAPLRARWPGLPFVGTVPAVKPAAAASTSKLISVLATPGTVSRDYTRKLVDDFAAGCEVTLVGSTRLAGLAEAAMRGRAADDSDILAEILPCFVEKDGRRTDAVALACTHYPLLLDAFRRLAPWPVAWIDPAPAIARRVDWVLAEQDSGGGRALIGRLRVHVSARRRA
ncbi:MAG: glutamate racemase [Rhodoblastus sp.]|nr:MAG: glutamate racemase [Rhodoblastus sp.]